MERLTWNDKPGVEQRTMNCVKCPKNGECTDYIDCKNSAVNRLAAIEDILGDDYDLDRLKVIVNQRMTMREEVAERFRITKDVPVERISELVEADRDGRCVVMPCKTGDIVYEANKRGFVSTYRVTTIHASNCSILVGWEILDGVCTNLNGFEASAIGKTVFLTRESAEAALKGKQDG